MHRSICHLPCFYTACYVYVQVNLPLTMLLYSKHGMYMQVNLPLTMLLYSMVCYAQVKFLLKMLLYIMVCLCAGQFATYHAFVQHRLIILVNCGRNYHVASMIATVPRS